MNDAMLAEAIHYCAKALMFAHGTHDDGPWFACPSCGTIWDGLHDRLRAIAEGDTRPYCGTIELGVPCPNERPCSIHEELYAYGL